VEDPVVLNYSDVDPDPDGFWSARSGSRRAKMTHKHRRKKNGYSLFIGLLQASPVAWTSFLEV
jgi:hypothetical protein